MNEPPPFLILVASESEGKKKDKKKNKVHRQLHLSSVSLKKFVINRCSETNLRFMYPFGECECLMPAIEEIWSSWVGVSAITSWAFLALCTAVRRCIDELSVCDPLLEHAWDAVVWGLPVKTVSVSECMEDERLRQNNHHILSTILKWSWFLSDMEL